MREPKECAYCEEPLKWTGWWDEQLNARVCKDCHDELKKQKEKK